MERAEVILLTGIIIGLIWMLLCVIIEGKNRKYVIMAGIIMDLVLFIVCRNLEMLLIALVGGISFGFIPLDPRKYETAVQEMKGIRNWVLVFSIFIVMMFMIMAIAYPALRVKFSR